MDPLYLELFVFLNHLLIRLYNYKVKTSINIIKVKTG